MRKYLAILSLFILLFPLGLLASDIVSSSGQRYLFAYFTDKNENRNGMHLAWSEDGYTWNPIGPEYSFLKCDYGCVAHGDGLHNLYRWKNTIGPLEARVPQRNLWGYHQTAGLGYFEYFQFCDDIGAEPLPVLAAGVCCQNSRGGGQQGIPMCEMDAYIQDILDSGGR